PPARGSGEIHYRKCVACGKLMNRINFGRVSGTVVDVCKGHGTFLDAGELHLIVSFIQQGGLDRARQRQIDELQEQVELMRATPRTIATPTSRPPPARGTAAICSISSSV